MSTPGASPHRAGRDRAAAAAAAARTGAVLAASAVLAAGVAACATPVDLPAGLDADAVVQRLGRPTAEHPSAAGGRRLEYGGGTFGRVTYMVDLDAAGRLTAVEQVRTEARFNALRPGMTAAEVRAQIGAPSTTWGVRYHDQTVWSYRYETPFCQWFMVGMTPDGHLEDTAYGPDPVCDRDPFELRGFGRRH